MSAIIRNEDEFLYQMFTYIKNKDYELRNVSQTVSGMLLYAGTDNLIQPETSFKMSGNKISAETLNLNGDFKTISDKLDSIAINAFKVEKQTGSAKL